MIRLKQPGNLCLGLPGRLPRVGGIADGATYHDVIGPVEKGLFQGDDPLLIIARPVCYGPDAG